MIVANLFAARRYASMHVRRCTFIWIGGKQLLLLAPVASECIAKNGNRTSHMGNFKYEGQEQMWNLKMEFPIKCALEIGLKNQLSIQNKIMLTFFF